MSKRLQIRLDDVELADIRRAARRQRMAVSDWVRQVLRQAYRGGPQRTAARKLAAIRAGVRHEFPTANIDRMLAEIEPAI